jgi:hypothetical protein
VWENTLPASSATEYIGDTHDRRMPELGSKARHSFSPSGSRPNSPGPRGRLSRTVRSDARSAPVRTMTSSSSLPSSFAFAFPLPWLLPLSLSARSPNPVLRTSDGSSVRGTAARRLANRAAREDGAGRGAGPGAGPGALNDLLAELPPGRGARNAGCLGGDGAARQ